MGVDTTLSARAGAKARVRRVALEDAAAQGLKKVPYKMITRDRFSKMIDEQLQISTGLLDQMHDVRADPSLSIDEKAARTARLLFNREVAMGIAKMLDEAQKKSMEKLIDSMGK